ncbi:MAG: YndJ family protein [Pyrinomonadaceae bacterium]|nr:YndJ family protein [Pyrinomonadaceae bacterium]
MTDLYGSMPRWGRLSAALGGLVWFLLFLARIGDSPETALMQRIVLLGILVIVPLALSLVPSELRDAESLLYRLALLAQPFAAIGAVVSFLLDPGVPAAVGAFLWFSETALIAMFGLQRLSRPKLRSSAEVSINAGLIFVPVAGVWLVVHRLGIQLLGYGDTIILLTAVHFHFAAYAAPILAGLAGRMLSQLGAVSRVFKLIPIGIIAGTPLVAAGISFSPALALVGTVMISIGLVLLAVLVVGWILPSMASTPGRVLLLLSSVSCLPAMMLACAYAYSIVFQKLIVDIPQMAMTHGVANAFGFSLCGLLGWCFVSRGDLSAQR